MEENNTVTFWFRHFKKRKVAKLKNKLSQMHPIDIKKLFKRSLKDYLLYDILKEWDKAIAIYMLSDDSLKMELDAISMELQNKKIEVNVVPIDYDLTKKRERNLKTILMWLGIPNDNATWFDRC
jgi:hypothetical protein